MTMPVNRLKLMAFAVGAGVAGVAGAIFAPVQGAVFPANFDLVLLITVYAMVVLGGAGSLVGVTSAPCSSTPARGAARRRQRELGLLRGRRDRAHPCCGRGGCPSRCSARLSCSGWWCTRSPSRCDRARRRTLRRLSYRRARRVGSSPEDFVTQDGLPAGCRTGRVHRTRRRGPRAHAHPHRIWQPVALVPSSISRRACGRTSWSPSRRSRASSSSGPCSSG